MEVVEKPGHLLISSARQQIRLTHTFWITTWNLPGKIKLKKDVILFDINELLCEVVCYLDLQSPKIGLFCLLEIIILYLILIPVKSRIVAYVSTFMVQHKISQLLLLQDVTPSSSIYQYATVLIQQQRGKSNKGPAWLKC